MPSLPLWRRYNDIKGIFMSQYLGDELKIDMLFNYPINID